ncbi:uncharacterized protein [Argopecten irradians]|uniref:uncharacterized protein n=1 Tax=Argopecten irradians TaxID=31199 RepID=UPI00371D4D86
MRLEVPLSAFLILLMNATLGTAIADDEQCAENEKLCLTTGKCGNCDIDEVRQRREAREPGDGGMQPLIVPSLVSQRNPAKFKLNDLMTAVAETGLTVKLDCPPDRTFERKVTIDGQTIPLTPDTLINFDHTIEFALTQERLLTLSPIYICRGITVPDDRTSPQNFMVAVVIVPYLANAAFSANNITVALTKMGESFTVRVGDLFRIDKPKMPIIREIENQINAEISEIKELIGSTVLRAVVEKLFNRVRAYLDVMINIPVIISTSETTGGFDIQTFVDGQRKSVLGRTINLGRLKSLLVFRKSDFTGLIVLEVAAGSPDINVVATTIVIELDYINYPPYFQGKNPVSLRPPAVNVFEFTASDVTRLFEDKNGDEVFAAILYAVNSNAGVWQFQNLDGSWEDVPKRDVQPKHSVDLNAVILQRNGKFRFTAAENLTLEQVKENTNIYFLATDLYMYNQRKPVLPFRQTISIKPCDETQDKATVSNSPSELCNNGPPSDQRVAALSIFIRCPIDCSGNLGCGKPLSMEPCPVCPNGELQNKCTKKCYQPGDTVSRDEGKDCAGYCKDLGMYMNYPAPDGQKICLRANLTPELVSQYVCQKLSNGDINKCGICYGGSTSNTETKGMDVCGVCNGDDSCDVSCAGVPNGPEITDSCGQCMNPTSVNVDTNSDLALKIGKLKPENVVAIGERMFKISVCNFDLMTEPPICMLKSTDHQLQLQIEMTKPSLKAVADLTGVTPGTYRLECRLLASKSPITSSEQNAVRVFAPPTGLSVTPTTANTNTNVNVTLCGSNLQSNTGTLKCAVTCLFAKGSKLAHVHCARYNSIELLVMDASFTQDGCVKCHTASHFKRVVDPGKHKLTAVFDRQMLSSFIALSTAEIMLITPPPVIRQVVVEGFCKLILHLDRYVLGSTNSAKVFSPEIEGRIEYRRKKVIVHLKDSVLNILGNSVDVLAGAFKQKTKETDSATVNEAQQITIPSPQKLPSLKLVPSKRGNLTTCETMRMIAVIKGDVRCMNNDFKWNVTVTGPGDPGFTSKVRLLTGSILKITANDLQPGSVYKIIVSVPNLPEVADTIFLSRISEPKAFSVKLVLRRKPDPLKGLVLKAKVKTLSCDVSIQPVDPRETKYVFTVSDAVTKREIKSSTDDSSSQFTIPRQTLVGGRTYIFAIRAYNEDSEATDSVEITIPKAELRLTLSYDAMVKKGNPFQIEANLDDPNNSPNAPTFIWECTTVQGLLCRSSLSDIFDNANNVAVVAGDIMPLGKIIVSVKVRLDDQLATANATVTCVQGKPPKLRMHVKGRPFVGENLLLVAIINSQGPVDVVYSCSVSDEGVKGDCEDFDMSEISLRLAFGTRIRRSIVFRNPGNYTIDAIATSSKDTSLWALASVTVRIQDRPIANEFTIKPPTGDAITTEFIISMLPSDSENEVMYQIRYRPISEDMWRSGGIAVADPIDLMTILPHGEYLINVKVCVGQICADRTSQESVIVNPIAYQEVEDLLSDLVDEDLVETAILVSETGTEISAATNVKMNEAVSKISGSASLEAFEEFMEEIKARLIPAIKVMKLEQTTKKMVKRSLRLMVKNKSQQTGENSRRRKRSTEDNNVIEALSVADAQTLLDGLVTVYSNDTAETLSREDSDDFVDTLETISARTCANEAIFPGNDPIYLNTNDVLLMVNELEADSREFNITTHNMTCTDCPEFTHHSAQINYSPIAHYLSEWNCTDSLTCNSACFVTGVMYKDFLFGGMDTIDQLIYDSSDHVSDIYFAKAYNPVEFTEVNPPSSENGVNFLIPLYVNSTELTMYAFECNMWTNRTWSPDPCMLNGAYLIESVPYVLCLCSQFGYVSITMNHLEESTTTADSVTTENETSTYGSVSTTVGIERSTSGSESSTSGSESSTSRSETASSGSGSESATSESVSFTSGSDSATSGSESSTSVSKSSTSESESSTSRSERATSGSESSTSGSESVTSGSESSTSGSESATSRSESSTSESESATSGSESSTSGSESATSGSESSTSGSESATSESESSTSRSERATSGSVSSTSRSESVTSGSESSTSGSESATSGSESSTSGSESATSGSESSTSGSESATSGSYNSTSGNDDATPTSSSTVPTTTTTTAPPVSTQSKEVRFVVQGDLNTHIQNSSKSEFEAMLLEQIATNLGIPLSRIKNFEVIQVNSARRKRSTPSFVVRFVITAPTESSVISIDDLVSQLENEILATNFTLTDANGNPLTLDSTSFSSRVYVESEPEKTDKHDIVIIVVGTVVGILCLIFIIVLILVVMKKKKRGLVYDEPSPSITPTPSYSDDKHAMKSYIHGVSASPLPEKPGAAGSRSPAISDRASTSSSTNKPRSDASLSREGSAVSHGNRNGAPSKDMPPIG